MPGAIAFTDVDVSAGALRCRLLRDDAEDELRFELPRVFSPADDLIAAAFATLCGEVYDEVRIDLPVGPRLAAAIEAATGARLIHRSGADVARTPGSRAALNFSGGFDSLAARLLMPDAELVSLDFGGRFARERPLFSRFAPHIVVTDLVDLGLNRNLGAFMAVGSILLRDELDLGLYAFGTIQAETLPQLHAGPSVPPTDAVAAPVGLRLADPVAGVSEVGTMLMVARTSPELLLDVLASVANPGEVKHHRKRLLLEAVAHRERLGLDLPPLPETRHRPQWGATPADDLSALYVMQVLGPEALAPMYKDGIPDGVVRWARDADLRFLERVNPHAYSGVPVTLAGQWYGRLAALGVTPFERADWAEAGTALDALAGRL